jgi:hypothetical protein
MPEAPGDKYSTKFPLHVRRWSWRMLMHRFRLHLGFFGQDQQRTDVYQGALFIDHRSSRTFTLRHSPTV